LEAVDVGPGQWEACVDRLYESIGTEEALAEAVGAFRHFFGAASSVLLTAPNRITGRSFHLAACGMDPSGLIEYHSHFCAHDEWVKAVNARGGMVRGRVYRGSELVPVAQMRDTYFGREFLARYSLKDIITTVVENEDADAPASFVTFHRLEDQPLYPTASVKMMERLKLHLARVMRVHRKLSPELSMGATLRDLFYAMDLPMFLVGRTGALVEANTAAERLFDEASGPVRVASGKVVARTADGLTPVAAWLDRFSVEQAESYEVDLFDEEQTLVSTLSVRKVHAAFTDRMINHPSAAVCALRPFVPKSAQAIRARFKLTDKEAEVAVLLAQGRSPKQIAIELGVANSTVRSHLSSLFDKVGARRQSELVARILSIKS